ncbi:MAG: 23S rRNA (pseudouridine(1915)-N(3))-methyltransferase RlmH [Erysipelotrichaceae bacterium]
MNFQIYVLANKPSKTWKQAIDEYQKRLSKYCKLEVIYCKDESVFYKKVKPKSHIISLKMGKATYDSVAFSQYLEKCGIDGRSDLAFTVGFVVADAQILSLSQMDFSTMMLTTTLLEQIYRSYRILNNEPYHK